MRSSLARFQSISPMDESELQEKRERAYHEQDIYIFTPEQRNRLPYRITLVLDEAAKLTYPKRSKR